MSFSWETGMCQEELAGCAVRRSARAEMNNMVDSENEQQIPSRSTALRVRNEKENRRQPPSDSGFLAS